MDRKQFDLVVIGSGPGGYVAAIKGAQEGLRVALIEKQSVGGTCLNVGCIPTKTLIAGALVLHHVKQAREFGIETGAVSFDYGKMKARKDQVVQKIQKSLEGLIQSNGVTILRGIAEFTAPNELKIFSSEGPGERIFFERAIIATGSEPMDIPAFRCDHKKILNSSSILELTTLPQKIAIIGGGYIGCEFASLFAELGVQVTIVEALSTILPLQGAFIADVLTKAFTKKGITLLTSTLVEKIDTEGSGVLIHCKGKDPVAADVALVSIGRRPYTQGLGLDKTGVQVNDKGEILVNDRMETSSPGLYAIGDVTGKYQLAHVASHQAIVAASNAAGKHQSMHYEAVPSVIFTHPEIAMVGLTLEQAQSLGQEICVGKFPFQALGKSLAAAETEGFAQVVTDKKTGKILGAQVVGHEASSLIGEMAVAIANECTIEGITETIHAHPTLTEAWLEAALLAQGTPIHFPPKKRV
ncbi:MAG: dihydrolipoyl dehydrogenase [Chlamydiae bacterium]|nr:dihydrolipoyl dehydrogenase [Chlamydiota bacterium]